MEAFFQPGRGSKSTKSSAASKQKPTPTVEPKNIPWVEKYRPKVVDDVIYQDEVVSVLKKVILGADLPNLLFYGPPGTGKTSAILAMARELYSNDIYKSRILELNASDDRGIQVIREKVKTFAQHSVSATRPNGRACPPFKIVILDEADSMTSSAQAALRRTMEKESKTTRFCLICNYISRIIEPLTSRCSKFRFKPLSLQVMKDKLTHICNKEEITYTDQALQVIINTSEGDMRKAITFIQSAHHFFGSITESNVLQIAGVLPIECIDNLLKACQSNSYDRIETAVKDIVAEGYSVTQLLSQISDSIIFHSTLSDNQKSVICERLGLIDKRLSDGANEYLQLLDLCSVIMTQYQVT